MSDTLQLFHAPVPLDLSFETDVCEACLGFLAHNPGETVILLASNDNDTDATRFDAMIRRIIAQDQAR